MVSGAIDQSATVHPSTDSGLRRNDEGTAEAPYRNLPDSETPMIRGSLNTAAM